METISAREIDRYIFDRNYLLVDVRQPADYRRMHVRGAVCAENIWRATNPEKGLTGFHGTDKIEEK